MERTRPCANDRRGRDKEPGTERQRDPLDRWIERFADWLSAQESGE